MILSKKATLGPSREKQRRQPWTFNQNPKNASRFFDDSLEEGNPWTFKKEAKKDILGPSRVKQRKTTLDLQKRSKEGNPWTFKREAKKNNLGPSKKKQRRQPWTFKREAKKTTLDLQEGSKGRSKKSPGLQREKKTPCHPRLAPCHPRLAPCHPRLAPCHPRLAPCHPRLAPCHPRLAPCLCAHPPARPPRVRPPFRPPPAAIKSNPKLADKFQDTRIIDIHPKKPILALIRQKQPLF